MKTLIDTSAWIPVLRQKEENTRREQIEQLLKNNRAAISAPIWCELYRGVRGKREESLLKNLRSLCIWLEFDAACWELAATHGRTCLRNGLNLPTSDLLIYCCAERHQTKLLHQDKHFDLIAETLG